MLTAAWPRAQRGASLIEVLVTLVILMIGLLGLAGVTTRVNVAAVESFQRVQALELVQDMAARLRGNADNAACYAGRTTANPPAANGDAPASLCEQDLIHWAARVKAGAATTQVSGGDSADGLIGALGCIDQASVGLYRVSVAWQGLQPTQAPTLDGAPYPCGAGDYGEDERLHRVAAVEVRLAHLGTSVVPPASSTESTP